MKAFVQRSVFVLLALLAARGDGLRGQWKIVAPNLLTSGGGGGDGAIYEKNGVIWAGIDTLWFSKDTGKSWARSFYTGYSGNSGTVSGVFTGVKDINFFDNRTGLIGASNGVYMTTDGGTTWSNILPGDGLTAVAFGGSESIIYALDIFDTLHFTTDEGLSWKTVGFGDRMNSLTFTLGRDGTIYIFSVDESWRNGWINSSTDGGETWMSKAPIINADSYTLIADSCDSPSLYLANENWVATAPGDNFSQIFVSTDAGTSWKAGFTALRGVISGNISASALAVYAGTFDSMGVLRSIDRGQTWTRISGPGWVPVDTRDIVALNDNIVFAIDVSGNIWATYNSGGDSVSSLGAPTALFATDSLQCDSLSVKALTFRKCSPIGITSWSFIGTDTESYQVTENNNSDSLSVSFHPGLPGNHFAILIVNLSNGLFDTITLEGFAIGESKLSLSTIDLKTDTIGDSIAVPITITGLAQPENINLTLHYDTTLQYQGSFDPSNVKLDIPGQQWPGRSKLNIASAQSGVVAGYARFTVFADSGVKPQVTFDSLDVLSASSPCEYTLPEAVTSTITPPSGCGTTILSEFLKSGQIPTFTIRPNPTMGDAELTSSLDLGGAEVEIYDMLGIKRADLMLTLAKDAPSRISLPDASGMYYLRIKSAAGISSVSVIVTK